MALEVLQCRGCVGERRPPWHRCAERHVICGRQRDTPLPREAPVHLGQQLRVEHGGGRRLLRRLVLRELRQHLLAPEWGVHHTQQRLQGRVQAALPVDQGSIAVEREHFEIGQFHTRTSVRYAHRLIVPRPSSMTSPLTEIWRSASTRSRSADGRPVYSPCEISNSQGSVWPIARHQPPRFAVADPVAGSSSAEPPCGKKKRARSPAPDGANTYAMLRPSTLGSCASRSARTRRRRTAASLFSGTMSCSVPAFTHSGRSPMSCSSSPSIAASVRRGSCTSRQLGVLACRVQRSPLARTVMIPAGISRVSRSPPRPSARHTCAVPSVGCPAKGIS